MSDAENGVYGKIDSPKRAVEAMHLQNHYHAYQAFVNMITNVSEPLKRERVEAITLLIVHNVPNAYKQNELRNILNDAYQKELNWFVEDEHLTSVEDIDKADKLTCFIRACMTTVGYVTAYNADYMSIEETQVIGI
jgi:hypothetical protein